ncbi:MAG: hypothetical protein JSS10_04515 [Verrucomicrobia bacterium]|nr:hypothetical protein [Verrucomicrobiota bacterium]
MAACCMKKIVSVLLSWVCSVYAVELPSEENLSVTCLDNGVQLWLKQHALGSGKISCRIVAKNPLEDAPTIFYLEDCPVESFEDELPALIEYCREKVPNEAQYRIAVVAVGDFEKEQLREFLSAASEVFSSRELIPPAKQIALNTSASNAISISLAYPASFQALKTEQDLKKLWILYLLQSIAEEKFRNAIKEVGGQWLPPAPAKYLLPYSHSFARGKQQGNQQPDSMLIAFLSAIRELKTNGFTPQELADAKARLQKNLLSFYQQDPTSQTMANYYASHFSFGTRCPSYPIFMTMSFQIISQIERKDLAEFLGSCFKDGARQIVMTVPSGANISEASIQKTLDESRTDDLVVKWEENSEAKTQYAQLPLSETEAQIIYKIIDIVGTHEGLTGLTKLGLKAGELEDLGNKVQHVHPFKFLEVVFTNPHLRKCMVSVVDSYFKRGGFLNGSGKTAGFIEKCERENARNNLQPHILGFCQAVKAHPDQVRTLVANKEWEKLIRYLTKLENN